MSAHTPPPGFDARRFKALERSGFNRIAARYAEGAHLRGSLQAALLEAAALGLPILTTPVGTRLERRTYGSLLPELIDHPDNGTTRVRIYAAVGTALMRWEPRVRLSRVAITSGPQPGQATLDLQAEYLPTSQTIGLQLALQLRASV